MCTTIIASTQSPTQAESLVISCDGQQPGDYLVLPAAHVVTLTQDAGGAQFLACTCRADLFYEPVPMTAVWFGARPACEHAQAVYTFLYARPAHYAAQVASAEALATKAALIGAPAAVQARLATALTEARYRLRQRLAARAASPEGASAPSLAGAFTVGQGVAA